VIFELHPPTAAGPLRIGATGHDTVETLRRLGDPRIFCRSAASRPAWGVHRPSGLFIFAYFDAGDRVEAIELGRPQCAGDTVIYEELDVFTTPAAGLITWLRQHSTVHEEEAGHSFTAPSLLLALWRAVTPESPDDHEGRFFDSVLIARPGKHRRHGT
jgi:hypothetical protein